MTARTFLSVCAGIDAASVAWVPAGLRCVAHSEVEPFPIAVTQYRQPDVPQLGDMTRFREWQIERPDIIVGGTPCQSFSVAGLRKGLDDPRGNLALVYLAMVERLRPDWMVWENVPGVLSSNGGRDFGAFVGALGELGYGWSYRILDAQYFGVPQQRRRVFVVGHSRGWQRPAAVLFERESLQRDPPPRRKAREGTPDADPQGLGVRDIAGCLTNAGGNAVPGNTLQDADQGYLISVTHTLRASHDASEDGSGRGTPLVTVMSSGQANAEISQDMSPALNCNRDGAPIAFSTEQISSPHNRSNPRPGSPCPTIGARANQLAATDGLSVRRLTPRECERLQGFPDDYTRIPWRGRPPEKCPDGPRYKALGNSMAVPVMRWIADRILMVEALEI